MDGYQTIARILLTLTQKMGYATMASCKANGIGCQADINTHHTIVAKQLPKLIGNYQELSLYGSNTTATTSDGDALFYAYYYGVLFLLTLVGLVGNILVIRAVWKHDKLRLPANYFIFSLACSDLGLVLLYPIYNVSHIEDEGIKATLGEYLYVM